MAINQEIISTSWEGQQKSFIEAGLKSLLQQMLGLLEGPLAANSVGSNQLTQELRDVINSIGSKVPNTRTVNNKELSSNIAIGPDDIMVGNQTLADKLDDMDDAIGQGGDTSGLAPRIAALESALDQLTGTNDSTQVIDTFNEVIDFLANVNNNETLLGKLQQLQTQINSKANDNAVVKSISVNGTPQTKDGSGNVNIQVQGGQVTVTTNNDGSFTIHSGDNDYTINLNHTHEGMAKLEKFVASNPPASMANDTIYVQVDNLTTPTEIESLWLFGLKFAGGGVPDTGEPMIVSPSNGSTLNLGDNSAGSGVSKTITVKGKYLTGDLTVAVGTGLTISYGQSTGQSSVTIPMAQALLGAQVTIAYSGSGALADGSLVISHGGSALSSVVVVVVTELPNGYTRLEYVDNAVRGIDTGILATDSQDLSQSVAGSSWEVDVQCNSAPSANEMVVVGNEDVAHWFGAVASTGCFGSGSTEYCFSSPATTRQQIQVAFFSDKIVLTSGGVTKTRNYTYKNNYNVCLLRNVNPKVQQYAGYQFTGRVYSIRCTSGGSFDAVPAQRTSDSAKGLYDKANQVFYSLT